MIRYRHVPDNPENPIIEATPKDIDQQRPFVRSYLRRAFSLSADRIDDIVQDTLFVTCRAAAKGKIRGHDSTPPKAALRAWLAGVAWRLAMNVIRSAPARRRNIQVSPEVDCVDCRSPPNVIVDARGLLEKLVRQTKPRGLRALLLLAEGLTVSEIAREVGMSAPTVMKEIRLARRRLAFARDRAPWQKPRQPPPQSPRSRKRQR